MGTIRNAQLDLLTNSGQEFIQFKRYDKDGVYLETLVEDVLLTAPDEVIPIGNDMTVEYLPPIKKAEYITKVDAFEDVHPNSHFMYSTSTNSYKWVNSASMTFVSPAEGSNPVAFPLSKNVYARDSQTTNATTMSAARAAALGMIGTADGDTSTFTESEVNAIAPVPQKSDVKIEFEYFIDSDADFDLEIAFELKYILFHNSTVIDYDYDAETADWVYNTNPAVKKERNFIRVQDHNQWQKFTLNVPPLAVGSLTGDPLNIGDYTNTVHADFRLSLPIMLTSDASNFNQIFIDNLKISEAVQTRSTAIMENKSRTTSVISNFYQSKDNILSNALKNSKHDGRILGDYVTRISPNAVKPIDQLITQEMINDYREYVKRFEGTFFNTNPEPIPISLHNKLWMNFQTNQEPVSSIIDSMSYSLKKNEYKIVCHIPNQDDDVSADFQIKYE
jgi:hypothetical protein